MKAILVLNSGSSSIKFVVIEANNQTLILSGVAERLDSEEANITLKMADEKFVISISGANHEAALAVIVAQLKERCQHELIAVGHRVVHGGELFSASCVIDESVLASIEACVALAPLHNPASITGILAAQKMYPDLKQIAVFDTAFHQTLPETAYLYALPYAYYEKYGVRRYGFHGTSYRYINQIVSSYNKGQGVGKVIVMHLGNGSSVCAIENGQSVATSMGLTPLDGLVQGTRTGSIDPAILSFLADKTGKPESEITDELWKKSGFLGLSEYSNDCRALEEKAKEGHEGCQRALAVFIARLQEVIGSYAALMNGVDALVFTGGIGENSSFIRKETLKKLGYLGFQIDDVANDAKVRGAEGDISQTGSKSVWVIPTNEELMIAQDTLNLI